MAEATPTAQLEAVAVEEGVMAEATAAAMATSRTDSRSLRSRTLFRTFGILLLDHRRRIGYRTCSLLF